MCSHLDDVCIRDRIHLVTNSNNHSLLKSHHLDKRNTAADDYESGKCTLHILMLLLQAFTGESFSWKKVGEIQCIFSIITHFFKKTLHKK